MLYCLTYMQNYSCAQMLSHLKLMTLSKSFNKEVETIEIIFLQNEDFHIALVCDVTNVLHFQSYVNNTTML